MDRHLTLTRRMACEERLLAHADELRAHITARIPTRFRAGICVDDVLQETWATVFRAISDFVPSGPDGFIRWLKTVANRRILDAIRDTRNGRGNRRRATIRDADQRRTSMDRLFADLTDPGKTPSGVAATNEATDLLRVVLSSLPKDRRAAIQLRHLEGRSRKEIAEQMCKTVPAVNSLLYHGLRQLREGLGDVERYLSGDHLTRETVK